MNGDVFWLRGIAAHAYHGVFGHERRNGQPFFLDVGVEFDTRTAARTDDITATVSYADVAERLHSVLTGEPVNLLETLAERLAAAVLTFPGIAAATVTVHKPQAPLALQFDDVSLTIRRTPLSVVPPTPVPVALGLGGNLGDVTATLSGAVEKLLALLEGGRAARPVRTAALTLPGAPPQADYWNTVVTGATRLSPLELLEECRVLEEAAGRVREERWGPRTLDVDVLAYGGLVSHHQPLLLPHPGAAERPFVIVPWAELEPERALLGEALAARAARLQGHILERRGQ